MNHFKDSNDISKLTGFGLLSVFVALASAAPLVAEPPTSNYAEALREP